MAQTDRAAVVQGDRSVLLEVDHPGYEAARQILARFAEIEKSPEHVHTYRLSDLALWNAASAGARADEVIEGLRAISRYDVPASVEHEIRDRMARHGVCSLHDHPSDPALLRLAVRERFVRERLAGDKKAGAILRPAPDGFVLDVAHRGLVKQTLLGIGYPVDDRAGLVAGAPLPIATRDDVFTPYPYQRAAVDAFVAAGSHGVVVLPCGAGKTVVAMMAMAALGVRTLVLTSGREAGDQWRREILAKTTLGEHDVAVYSSARKSIASVTISTYAMLAQKGGTGPTRHTHFDRLASEPWGLVVYDEVHLLPAPVFRLTAELQARRRLGLTATLVREDGREGDVFALIGPKRHDVPWRELEKSGHIATATCFELRVPLPAALQLPYAHAERREQPRIAGENPLKLSVLRQLAERHAGDRLLVLGSFVEPLAAAGALLGAPVITGETAHAERERAYADFRSGRIRRLVLSKVGNFAIDLPEANVLVQLSGTMGSRQEEAQRLGRVLRPKPGGATFYTLVTRDTVEQENALHRQLFLTEQGYRYFIEDWTGDDDGEANEARGPVTLH
ncbi:DNA repair helicase XPB [Sandaracinus amylolyticus]|uniref:DNA 3'-5' helicase n=1 Tax=Sandaracinus amylolyticus TaxID=927083 RepID=A0A0F6W7X0_9BACT|nr:DNA repair helicase XPB [Sandaracinus amylolyticus]AKF09565.1 DNA repair helicase [Sandaracinus amylolyticus]